MRKRAKIREKLEKMSVSDGIRAVKFSEVVVIVLDVKGSFESQDLRIADFAEREGRCLVIAINKWDLEDQKSAKIRILREKVRRLLPQLSGVPLVTISGLKGTGLNRLRDDILNAYRVWNIRVSTSRLNNWLIEKVKMHPPPSIRGRRLKIRYITQVNNRPPSFIVFCSTPNLIPDSYKRYLINNLRKDFNIPGTPIRLMLRAGKNPYDRKD